MIPSSVDRCGMWTLTGGEVVGGGWWVVGCFPPESGVMIDRLLGELIHVILLCHLAMTNPR